MVGVPASTGSEREAFDLLLRDMRPKLHRYCARMTGSVIDGEDVVQETLVRAIEAFGATASIKNPEGWLFRIAHNAALDFLRRRARREAVHSDEELEMIVDPTNAADDRQAAAASLRTFMRLPVAERSSVVLKDVLGYSLQEVGAVMGSTIPAVKAALHRGRVRLGKLAAEPDDQLLPVLTEPQRSQLAAYVERFNARDFDAVRDMLAEEVRLELVAKVRMKGRKEVATYLNNYALAKGWRFLPGFVERRPAVLVRDGDDPGARPAYFVLLEWAGDHVLSIRDFRFARYVIESAELSISD